MLKISRVTIVTVCFNSAKTIEGTIQSVLSQDYPDIEYVVIDGGSTDGTLDIIKKYGDKISKFVSEKDNGIYFAMNKGLKMANGEILGTLNSDDIYADSHVVSRVAEKFSSGSCDVLWGDLVYVKADDLNKVVRTWRSSEFAEGKFKKGWHPPHPTFFVKKNIYEKYGYFNTNFRIAADIELMLRLLERYGVKSCHIPSVMVKMRSGGASNKSLKNILRANLETYRAWKINGLKISPWKIMLKPLSKIIQYFK